MEMIYTDTPRSRRNDSESSHEAADRVKTSGSLAAQQSEVLCAVRRWPGCTAIELAHHMTERDWIDDCRYEACVPDWRFYHDWTRRRLPELAPHLIQKGPIRVCKKSGRKALTWFPRGNAT